MANQTLPDEATSTAGTVPAANPPPSGSVGEPEEDEDQWEYEYSKTETETYYIPVDFSIPQFSRRHRYIPSMTRGGSHYRNWTGLEHQKRPEMKHHRLYSEDDDDGDGDLPLPESEEDDEGDETMAGPSSKAPGGQDDNDDGEPEEIQVLDLHSEKPIFRYRKRVFEGSWSRVLGTELLFAERTGQDNPDPRVRPLPSIRSLPGDVDLLAASWSHITTTEVELEPRQKDNSPSQEDPLMDIKRDHGIQIPIWSDKTGERADQTRFLEDLMALKLKKGEKDAVTVYAQAPDSADRIGPRPRGARAGYSGRGRPPGRGRASKMVGDSAGGDVGPDGKKRRQPLPDSRPVKVRRPYGTGPRAMQTRARAELMARPRLAPKPAPVEVYDESSSSDDDDDDDDEDDDDDDVMLSQPTPHRWSDLEQSDNVEADESTSSDEDYEDYYGDGNGQGETGREDTPMANAP